jgi:hypothetical protein
MESVDKSFHDHCVCAVQGFDSWCWSPMAGRCVHVREHSLGAGRTKSYVDFRPAREALRPARPQAVTFRLRRTTVVVYGETSESSCANFGEKRKVGATFQLTEQFPAITFDFDQ